MEGNRRHKVKETKIGSLEILGGLFKLENFHSTKEYESRSPISTPTNQNLKTGITASLLANSLGGLLGKAWEFIKSLSDLL